MVRRELAGKIGLARWGSAPATKRFRDSRMTGDAFTTVAVFLALIALVAVFAVSITGWMIPPLAHLSPLGHMLLASIAALAGLIGATQGW